MKLSREEMKQYLANRISPEESYEDLLQFPRFFEIETVHACNARCAMCTKDEWTRTSAPMTDALFEKIAAEVCNHAQEIKRVSLYRDGEPLLDPKLPDRIARLKQGGIRTVAISTNASLLNEQRAKALLTAGLDMIILSVDSLEKETYEGIRGGLDFETVLENSKRFYALRDQYRPETSIWMRMVRQESNWDQWPGYEAYWKPYAREHDRVFFHHIFNWGGQLKSFTQMAETLETQLPCVALWSLMAIFSDGSASLCNVDFNGKHLLGDTNEQSIEELWKSELQQRRRELHLSGNKGEIDICTNCNAWDEPSDKDNVSQQFISDESKTEKTKGK